ncbi:hypothetical protein V8C86DRAFT_2833925 [Haematococcus lacustris]
MAREGQLELGVIINNYRLAQAQGKSALARATGLQQQLDTTSSALGTAQEQLTAAQQQVASLQAELGAARTALQAAQQGSGRQQSEMAAQEGALRKLASRLLAFAAQELAATSQRLRFMEEQQAARLAAAAALHLALKANPGALDSPKGASSASHSNVNRYWCPPGDVFALMKALAVREAALVRVDGFLGMSVREAGAADFVVSTQWASRQAFEAWASSREANPAIFGALPSGVMQYAPRSKGEGVPEPYLPLRASDPPA